MPLNDETIKQVNKIVSFFNSIPTLEVNDVTDFFTNNVPSYRCPVCGGKEFEILSDDGKYVTVLGIVECKYVPNGHGQTSSLTSTTKAKYIQLHCKKCHFICNHNYVTLRFAILNNKIEKAINERK